MNDSMASHTAMAGETVLASQDEFPVSFAFLSGTEDILCHGVKQTVDRAEAGRAGFTAGALPFDRDAAPHLFVPAMVRRGRELVRRSRTAPAQARAVPRAMAARPAATAYGAAVEAALAAMATDPDLRKVVLARSLQIQADAPLDPAALLRRLARDPAATAFHVHLPPSQGAARALIGASPELLLDKRGPAIVSHPLAGSARRQADPAADRAAAEGLARSEKDRREHQFVVEAILDSLAPWCRELAAPVVGELTSTASMWHLGTRIEGVLKSADAPVLDIVADLHPTPAVCGTPREQAARTIAALEGFERDFFAGAVGWLDGRGDGRWMVSIRCAQIAGDEATLYAGAGVVPGSVPAQEIAETAAKFRAMLDALNIDFAEE